MSLNQSIKNNKFPFIFLLQQSPKYISFFFHLKIHALLNMNRQDDMEFMDIDGPEFIADVNHQIADIRASYSGLNQNNDIKASAILEYTNNDEQHDGIYIYIYIHTE